ncbi:hypothetical protein B9Q20_14360 [Enterobacter mori]|nr:hypothetical protein B9Q20_14360 [Enterobacter mori]
MTGASESVCSYAAKLSHQFPATEVFFVSQINKHRQKNYPKWSKPSHRPRQYWLCSHRGISLQRFTHL